MTPISAFGVALILAGILVGLARIEFCTLFVVMGFVVISIDNRL